MRRPGRSRIDAIVRAAGRSQPGAVPGGAESMFDAVAEPVELPGGELWLVRPRDPDAVAFETVSAPDAHVEELHPPHWARLWASGTALARAIEAPPPSPGTGLDQAGLDDGRVDGAGLDRAGVGAPGLDRGGLDQGGLDGAGVDGAGLDRAGLDRGGVEGAGPILVRGRSVLELGCGLGLPSLAAARAGGRVLATDRSPGAVAYVAATAVREGIELRSAACAWDDAEPIVEQGPWDLVLAADVIYGQEALTVLSGLLPRLAGDGGEVWLADPRRPLAPEFLADARGRWREVGTVDSPVPGVRLHRLRGPRRHRRRGPDRPPASRRS